MKKLKCMLGAIVLMFVGLSNAQSALLSDLLSGGSIASGGLLFDNWSNSFYDSGDGRTFDPLNINVTALADNGTNGAGILFTILNNEMSVTGNNSYNYVDLTLGFNVSTIDPGMGLIGNTLSYPISGATTLHQGDPFNNLGASIREKVNNGGLADGKIEFSMLDNILTSVFPATFAYSAQNSVSISKNILVWSVDNTDTATLTAFEQRFALEPRNVPEPGILMLLGIGLAGLIAGRSKVVA